MKISARGLLFVGVLLGVTYFACLFIVTPLFLLLPISLSLYRRWIDYLLGLWLHLPCVSQTLSIFMLNTITVPFFNPVCRSQALLGKSLQFLVKGTSLVCCLSCTNY